MSTVAEEVLQKQLQNALSNTFAKPDPVPPVGGETTDKSSFIEDVATIRAREQAEAKRAAEGEQAASPAAPAPSAELEALKAELAEMKKLLAKATAKPKEPVAPKPTVRGVEDQVSDLRKQLQDMESLNEVTRTLPTLPEYATLQSVPSIERQVMAELNRRRAAAREAGEGAEAVTVAAVAKDIKAALVENYKTLARNPELLKEAGLSASSSQQAPKGSTSRALTGDMASSGQGKSTQVAKSDRELLKMQLARAMASFNQ